MSADSDTAIDHGPDRGRRSEGDFEYLHRAQAPHDGLQDANQPALFSADELRVPALHQVISQDLIVPDSLRNMKKPVAAIHAIPVKGGERQTLNGRRLFDGLILAAQIDVRGKGPQLMERIRNDRVSPLFEVHITDLARLSGIPGKNYERLYQDLDEIYDMKLLWNVIGEDSTVEWEMKAHFLSTYGRGVNGKRGLVRFSIDPSILTIVLEPSNWATLSLQVMRGLSTETSYALYQNTWRYVNTAQKVTAALPVETWIELLLGPSSRFVKTDGEGRKYVEDYGGFKARYLADAIERVNNVAALSHTLELRELKSGRKVAKLQFKFVRKQQHALALPVTWPAAILDPMLAIGFTSDEIAGLSEGVSVEIVKQALEEFEVAKRRLKDKGVPMVAPKRYFEPILDKWRRGAPDEQIDAERLEAQVRQEDLQREAEERRKRLEERFTSHLRDRFRDAFFELPDVQRDQVTAQFERSSAFASAKVLVEGKGWTRGNSGALTMLRQWMEKEVPDFYQQLLPQSQDRDLQAWLLWQTEQALLKAGS